MEREIYLKRIRPWFGKPLVKVLTGLRRSGKSTLLHQVAEDLVASGQVVQSQIVSINFELMEFESLRSAKALYGEISRRLPTKSRNAAVLLDEVQECDGWEGVVNSLLAEGGVDLYVTGSNSHLLSSELATTLTGRYVEISIYTLGFAEHLQFVGEQALSRDEEFSRFWQFGGFPGLHQLNATMAQEYLQSLYNTVLLRDVVERNNIRDVKVLERILRFAFDNIGNLVTANSISAYLKSQKLDTSVRTVQSYLGYAEACFALHRLSRFDIKGKRHLEIGDKYYLGDLGLRQAM
ncbi:MAG TPA: ATP-binding protein, partial [Fibrobacteraceae bacterium]|nr:ATP-binding protein [Fibrobacteraceae bacterium]